MFLQQSQPGSYTYCLVKDDTQCYFSQYELTFGCQSNGLFYQGVTSKYFKVDNTTHYAVSVGTIFFMSFLVLWLVFFRPQQPLKSQDKEQTLMQTVKAPSEETKSQTLLRQAIKTKQQKYDMCISIILWSLMILLIIDFIQFCFFVGFNDAYQNTCQHYQVMQNPGLLTCKLSTNTTSAIVQFGVGTCQFQLSDVKFEIVSIVNQTCYPLSYTTTTGLLYHNQMTLTSPNDQKCYRFPCCSNQFLCYDQLNLITNNYQNCTLISYNISLNQIIDGQSTPIPFTQSYNPYNIGAKYLRNATDLYFYNQPGKINRYTNTRGVYQFTNNWLYNSPNNPPLKMSGYNNVITINLNDTTVPNVPLCQYATFSNSTGNLSVTSKDPTCCNVRLIDVTGTQKAMKCCNSPVILSNNYPLFIGNCKGNMTLQTVNTISSCFSQGLQQPNQLMEFGPNDGQTDCSCDKTKLILLGSLYMFLLQTCIILLAGWVYFRKHSVVDKITPEAI